MGKAVPYRKWFIGKPRTVERNAQNLRAYCEWLSKTPEELRSEYVKARKTVDSLEDWERETRNNILGYYNYLKENDYAINSARTLTTGVMAFYSQNCKRIQGITKELDPQQIPENEYVFTQEVLRKMYYYGNAFEKAWLSCAVSLGYASEDFLELETEKIANLIKEAKDKKTRLHRIYRQDQNKNQCSTKMHPDCRSHKQFRRISEDS